MQYHETFLDSEVYKKEYISGLEDWIIKKEKEAETVRAEHIKDIFADPEAYRAELAEMLGYPLCEKRPETAPSVQMEKLSEEESFSVYRMRYEILEGVLMTGLFFRQKGDEKRPLVIVQHGGEGSPELISGVYGFTNNYNDMLMRVFKHGVHVFAPQLLLWKPQRFGAPYDRDAIDARLKSLGSSIAAVEVYGIMRALDYFEGLPYVGKFGMVGLSYGGFYTQYTTALDTRIRSAISCSYFNERKACFHADWSWKGSAKRLQDAELACLVYPRRLCIELGRSDELFACESGIAEFERLKALCAPLGTDADWLDFILYDGTHEFCREDTPIERLVADIQND